MVIWFSVWFRKLFFLSVFNILENGMWLEEGFCCFSIVESYNIFFFL